ncbi:MAG: NADP-dependent oxidoreductase [Xanthobacteraceae bacterium]
MSDTARRIVLASRPPAEPQPENFRLEEFPVPTPGDGEILLRTLWLSLDPYMRGRMSDAPSYAAPVGIGQVMEGGTVSEVVSSRNSDYKSGDKVLARSGWQSHAISDGTGLRKLDPKAAPLSYALGILGMPGMTAYFGLADIGKPQPGEMVVVAAASGAVGSVVGQIAKIRGARVVGIAGGEQKCRYLTNELGFDAAVDHRAADFAAKLKTACPKGIDVYFENVGGKIFEVIVPLLNTYARVPVCGVIAQYNDNVSTQAANWVPALMRTVLTKRLTLRGFIVTDFFPRSNEFAAEVVGWVKSGKLKYREDIVEGLENAPRGLIGLLRGENFGKRLVRVAAS